MVSNWCQASYETLENKGNLKEMKLGIVIHVPFFCISIYPYKSL